jgi:hypothetical protein
MKYNIYNYVIDIFAPYLLLFPGNRMEEILLLILFDYNRLLGSSIIVHDIKLLEYEYFIDYVLRHTFSNESRYTKPLTMNYLSQHYNVMYLYIDDILRLEEGKDFHVNHMSKISLVTLRILFDGYRIHDGTGYIFKLLDNGSYKLTSKLLVEDNKFTKRTVPGWSVDIRIASMLRDENFTNYIEMGLYTTYLEDKAKYKFNLIL